MRLLNLLLGTLIVTVGLWLVGGAPSQFAVAGWTFAVGGFLWWRANSLTEVWAWTTFFLGLESFAWPLTLMIQLRAHSETPSQDEMGTILSAVVLCLFSSVFWISFSYGLFKRAWRAAAGSHQGARAQPPSPPAKQKRTG